MGKIGRDTFQSTLHYSQIRRDRRRNIRKDIGNRCLEEIMRAHYAGGDKILASRSSDVAENLKTQIPHADVCSLLSNISRSRSLSIDYDHGETKVSELLSAHVAVLVIGENLVSGTVLIVAPDLVITALHVIEGWNVRSMSIRFDASPSDEHPKLIQVNGVVEMSSVRDYCILQLTDIIPDRMKSCKITGKLPSYAYLAHYPHGYRLHITSGKVIRESFLTDNIVAFKDTLELSTGGGYFTPDGELFAIHLTKGVSDNKIARSPQSIYDILRANPNSALQRVREEGESYEPGTYKVLPEMQIPIQVKVLYAPFARDNKDTLIPCYDCNYIENTLFYELSNERTLYYYAAIHLLHVGCLQASTGRIITVNSHGKGGEEHGVSIEYNGYVEGRKYRQFTASINSPITLEDKQGKKNLSLSLSKSTDMKIATVEIADGLCEIVLQNPELTKRVMDRFKFALYRSMQSRRVVRIDYVSTSRLESYYP